jgi:anti-sigma regulatory factor (Ser/Thr protein kinase)
MPTVWGDETRLRQVLLNLYSNAAKFTEEGSIKLTVREVPEGIQFSLADTGCGISAENRDIIFEEFKQASPKGRDPRSGSGLGLTISRQLLDLMGGRIWVESEVGKGSTFHFIIQKYTGQDKVDASPEPEEKPVAQPALKVETPQPESNPAPAAVDKAQETQKSLAEAPAQQLAVTSASQEEEA